ncbi:MAG: PorT family protein [Bacteroidia bacterium]|nr:PorT family protein [Bacteroidia bacterium]
MKKLLLLLTVYVLSQNIAFGQKGFHLGFKVSPQSTWLRNQNDADANSTLDYDYKYGLSGGIFGGYHFTDNIGLELNFLYSSQGQKWKGTYKSPVETVTHDIKGLTNLNYFKMPLLLKFNTSPDAGTMFSFFLGPQLSFLMGSKEEHSYDGFTDIKIDGVNGSITNKTLGQTMSFQFNESQFSKTLFDAVFGMGVIFKVSDRIHINFDVRFDYSLSNAENKDATISGSYKTNSGQTLGTFSNVKYWKDRYHRFGDNPTNPFIWFTPDANNPSPKVRETATNIVGAINLGMTFVIPQ